MPASPENVESWITIGWCFYYETPNPLLVKEIHVPLTRIAAILAGKRAVTVDTALRLSRVFGTSEGF